jgi:hypothetical protein
MSRLLLTLTLLAGFSLCTLAMVVVVLVALRRRRSKTLYTGPRPSPEEVAYLNGGRPLAVQSALASLWIAAEINMRPVHDLPGATPLQRAVAAELALGRTGKAIVTSLPVDAALGTVRQSLQRKGLITGSERRTPLGQALLRQQRQEYAYLAPAQRPAWQTYGPAAAGLGVGLYGSTVFRAINPGLTAYYPARSATGSTGSRAGYAGGGPSG